MSVFQYYEYFYKVAITGNMTKAAKQLYITQPALSKAIANLENQLECQLFVRSRKGVTLTMEGELLLQVVRQSYSLLNDTKQKIDAFQNSMVSEVRIGVGRDLLEFYVLPRLAKMFAVYPTTRVKLEVLPSNAIFSLLTDSSLDIGLTTQPIPDERFTNHDLFDLQDCFIVGERYRHLADDRPHSIYEIANYPLVMLLPGSLSRKHVDTCMMSFGLVPMPIYQVQDTKMIAEFVKFGFGVGCVTEMFVQDMIDSGAIYKVALIESLPARSASLIWNARSPLNDAGMLLLKYLKDLSQ